MATEETMYAISLIDDRRVRKTLPPTPCRAGNNPTATAELTRTRCKKEINCPLVVATRAPTAHLDAEWWSAVAS